MQKIDEQIAWYTQNADRKDDDIIRENLNLIKNLFKKIEYSEDRIYMDKIISTFCEIMEVQREVIDELKYEAEQVSPGTESISYVANLSLDTFTTDEEFQTAFDYYLTDQVPKPLSSYTINDYFSRIKNVWKSFYEANRAGELPQELLMLNENFSESAFVNVYNHIEEIFCYISMEMACSDKKRNWANAQAALNKFLDFINYTRKRKITE